MGGRLSRTSTHCPDRTTPRYAVTVFCPRRSYYASQETPKRKDQNFPVPAMQAVARDFLHRAVDRVAAGWSKGGDIQLVWFQTAVGFRPHHFRFCHQPPPSGESECRRCLRIVRERPRHAHHFVESQRRWGSRVERRLEGIERRPAIAIKLHSPLKR